MPSETIPVHPVDKRFKKKTRITGFDRTITFPKHPKIKRVKVKYVPRLRKINQYGRWV